jgi:hypothetical protein
MSVADVASVLTRYDDDAWIALANRGLLRRATKDLEIVDVRVVAETDQAVEVAVGERLVRMGIAGPGEAACSCPSVVMCQHIITAGLWLASAAAGQPKERRQPEQSAEIGEPSVAQPADALHDDLMAIDAETLTAYAGLPGYRWAHQMLDDQETLPRVTRDGYLAITFERPPLTVRYLGGGLDGLVLDQSVSNVKRFRVAAVLAWQRAHGQVLQAPSAPRSRGTAEGEASLSRRESRTRLRSAVSELLRDAVGVGVSHLSPAIHERLTTAATWAQGVEYHRLALLLRRLADQVELLLARSAMADDVLLLDDIAVANALVAALESAAAHGTEPVALVGRARTSYDPVRSLDVVGLGGRPWHTSSGYHGLTCIFWSPSRQQFLTWTDARPDSLADFDPRARWQQPAPWTGLATPATSAGSRLMLTSAQVSADRRISGVESTSAAVTALDSDEMTSLLPVRTSWRELAPARIHGLSDPPDPTSQWSVLRPVQVLPAQWDAVNQLLTCALLDEVGETVTLKVTWSRLHAHVIGRLESLGTTFASGTLVVARVVRRRGQLVGEPLSLVLPGRPINPVDALHFDGGPARRTSTLVQRLLTSNTPDHVDTDDDQQPTAPVPAALTDLRSLIEREAQRGCAGVVPGVIHDRVTEAHRALRQIGLTAFADPDTAIAEAEVLLRSLYLLQRVEQALL